MNREPLLTERTHDFAVEDEPIIGYRAWFLTGTPEEPRLQSLAGCHRGMLVWPAGEPVGPAVYGFNAFDSDVPARGIALTHLAWGKVKLWGRIRRSTLDGTWALALGEYAYPLSVEVPMNPDAVTHGAGGYYDTETWVPENAAMVMAALREAYPGVEFTERWYGTPNHLDKDTPAARAEARRLVPEDEPLTPFHGRQWPPLPA